MTNVTVSTAWNLHLGAHNQTHPAFPADDPGWAGQLLQWRWDHPGHSSWTGYVRSDKELVFYGSRSARLLNASMLHTTTGPVFLSSRRVSTRDRGPGGLIPRRFPAAVLFLSSGR